MIRNIVPHFFFSIITFFLFIHIPVKANWSSAKEGDKIILIRHALAPGRGDPKEFKLDDCKTQRNLNQIGIDQSKKIGKLFKENKLKLIKFYSSQWCRCKDTAKYAFKDFKEFSALNSTFSPPYDQKEKEQIKELKNFVGKIKGMARR